VKVWARYAVPVMVLVDEDSDEIENVVLVAGERDIDRARPSMEIAREEQRNEKCR
jgi:hypothetical protein